MNAPRGGSLWQQAVQCGRVGGQLRRAADRRRRRRAGRGRRVEHPPGGGENFEHWEEERGGGRWQWRVWGREGGEGRRVRGRVACGWRSVRARSAGSRRAHSVVHAETAIDFLKVCSTICPLATYSTRVVTRTIRGFLSTSCDFVTTFYIQVDLYVSRCAVRNDGTYRARDPA